MPQAPLNLAGIFPPFTTPFDARGELDLAALEANLERYDATGLAGYVAFGSNGEAVHLTPEERRQVLATLTAKASPGKTLIAGVNAQSTREAIAAVDELAGTGIDAALVVTPYFYKGGMSQEALRVFFLELADATSLPIVIYNIPQNTGVTLAPSTLAELSRHERIVGLKDSSGNFGALAETLRLAASDFQVLSGNAGILQAALQAGAAGAILAIACLAPEAIVELYRAVQAGEHDRARDLQRRQAPVASMVTAELGVAGLKAALDLAGYHGGPPRGPLLPLDAASRQRLVQRMRESGLFPVIEEG